MSDLETGILPISPPSSVEVAGSTEATAGDDLNQPEVGKSSLSGTLSQQGEEQLAETSHTVPSAVEGSASGLLESVLSESQASLDSHVTTFREPSSNDVMETTNSTPAQPVEPPDASLPGDGRPVAQRSLSSRPSPRSNTTSRAQNSSGSEAPTASGTGSAADRSLVSNRVFFPDWSGRPQESPGTSRRLPSCDNLTVSAVHPVTGHCQLLGVSAGCPDDQLFLLAADGSEPGCRPLPCPEGQLLAGDSCRSVDDPTVCPPRMILVQDERGGGRCVCQPGHVLWPAEQRCYPALSRGPCAVGQLLTAPQDEPRPRCVDNPCVRDGSWLWLQPPDVGCFQLLQPEAGCESERLLALRDGRIVCDDITVRTLFNLPYVKCGDGALMDQVGSCRNPLQQGFRG